MDKAVIDFQKNYKIPLPKRILNRFMCIILRRAITDATNVAPDALPQKNS